MKIIIAGYGFYTLGDKELRGGTIFPAIKKWVSLSESRKVSLTCMVQNKDSLKFAKKRFNEHLKKYSSQTSIQDIEISFVLTNEFNPDEHFDCGIVATPENSHVQVIDQISQHTNNIICVKPIGNSYSDYLTIIDILKRNKCDLFIDFHKRFDESNLAFINNVVASEARSGWFNFFYGQKEVMPKLYFKKWSGISNPYQYLAPHYLDIIFLCLRKMNINLNDTKLDLSVKNLNFKDLVEVNSFIDVSLSVSHPSGVFHINSACNWMEPKMSPFTSRQRIEFQSEGTHVISDQDNRGFQVFNNHESSIPNPHFMTESSELISSGYGIDSFTNYFDFINGSFPKTQLANLKDYIYIAKILDEVKKELIR